MNDQQFSDAELAGLPWLMRATAENGWLGLLALLAIIVLAILVFNLGFARKLPPLKKGSHIRALNRWRFVLWLMEFAFGAPMIAILIISALVLGIYRFRLHLHRKEKQENA